MSTYTSKYFQNGEQLDQALRNAMYAVSYAPQILTEPEKAQARGNIGAADGIPKYEGTAIGEKCAEFSALMNESDKVESFLFFTDPHLAEGSGYEARLQEYLETVKNYYYGTPTSFVVCGGDWIGNSDTQENACFKLGYIDGLMRRHFDDDFHMVVGNHDTNEQGVNDTGAAWSGVLATETVRNLWNRKNGSNYYSFDGVNTKFYVLDTWRESTMTDYQWEQIAWLADKLKTDDAEHSAIFMHEAYSVSTGSPVLRTFATNVIALCNAYNKGDSVTLNSVAHDFFGCSGQVRFILSGHTHEDYSEMVDDIPVITTANLRNGNTPTFDLCMADYTNNKLNLVRVGSGESREVDLYSGLLPSGYTQLSHIEATSTQYIKTDIIPTDDLVVEISNFKRNDTYVKWGGIIGSQTADNSADSWLFRNVDESSGWGFDYAGGNRINHYITDKNYHNFVLRKGSLVLDGNKKTSSPAGITATYPLWIFTTNQANAPFRNGAGCMGRIKFYNGSGLIADYVACQNPDGEIGLYELVSKTFHGNDGGADPFIGGEPIEG